MGYKVTLEDIDTGNLISEVVNTDKRKDAVITVNKKYGDKAVVVDIEHDTEDDTMKYQQTDDAYEVLIGGTDDK